MAERTGILVTRPEPRASVTAAHVAALGLAPITAPLLSIRLLAPHLPAPAALQAVLAASANALPGLPALYRRLPLFAVGDATAARARALHFSHVSSAAGDAASLARLVVSTCRPAAGPLLLAAGARQGAPLARSLRAEGFAVFRRSLYAAHPVARLPATLSGALTDGRVAVALFFSAETAHTFVRLVTAAGLTSTLAEVAALAIGEAAARVLRPLPFRCVRVALRPTEEALLAMLA